MVKKFQLLHFQKLFTCRNKKDKLAKEKSLVNSVSSTFWVIFFFLLTFWPSQSFSRFVHLCPYFFDAATVISLKLLHLTKATTNNNNKTYPTRWRLLRGFTHCHCALSLTEFNLRRFTINALSIMSGLVKIFIVLRCH